MLLLPTVALLVAIFTHVDIVAQGVGRVVPLSAVRPVDAQVAGEIVEVAVEPSASVKEGDIILRLDDTELKNSLLKADQKILQLQHEVARTEAALATATKHDPTAPEYESYAATQFETAFDSSTDLAKLAMARLRAELITHAASVAETDATIKSLLSEIAGIDAQIVKAQSNLVSESTNIAAAKKLILNKKYCTNRIFETAASI